MQKNKIVALVMGTALAATIAVGATACSGKKSSDDTPKTLGTTTELNIADYAAAYDSEDSSYSYTGLTSAKALFTGKTIVNVSNAPSYLVVLSDTKTVDDEEVTEYSVYSTVKEGYILSGLSVRPTFTNIGLSLIKVQPSSGKSEYAYYTYDGTQILAAGRYSNLSASSMYAYVGGSDEQSIVYVISGEKGVTKDDVTTYEEFDDLYINRVEDEDTGIYSYASVQKSAIKFVYDDGYNGIKQPVYPDYEEMPVTGDIANYQVSVSGNKYTFYNGSEEKGTVDLTDCNTVGLVGNYLYYTAMTAVTEASDYNVVMLSEYGNVYYDTALYKYDIINDAVTEIECDVYVESLSPVYNYTTKSYDAAEIYCYKMTDGVAVIGEEDVGERTYFVDSELNVGYDLTGTSLYLGYGITDIGGGKYLIGYGYYDTIVDSDFNVINDDVYSSYVYGDEQLVLYRQYESWDDEYLYGFTDYEGNVVIAPEYTSRPVFYGGVAYVTNAWGEEVFLKKDGTVTKVDDLTATTAAGVEKEIEVSGNGYYVITTATTTTDEESGDETVTYKTEIYSYAGTLLKSFNHQDVYISQIGGSYVIKEKVTTEDTDHNEVITYNYYKLG